MTVIVGVLCEDGVVVGSDSSATFSASSLPTIEQRVPKTFVVGNDLIFAGTGQGGLSQRFGNILSRLRQDANFFASDRFNIATAICRTALQDFNSTFAQPGQLGALVAFACQNHFHLCEFSGADFQPEHKDGNTWFVTMGSGQLIADPFLAMVKQAFFSDQQPRLREGIFAVTWALDHTIRFNTGGINGPSQIAVLSRNNGGTLVARLLDSNEIGEHLESVKGIQAHVAAYREILNGNVLEPAPQSPAPPAATPDDAR